MILYLSILGYKIYISDSEIKEDVHFCITKEDPSKDDTKIWALKNGSFQIAHNKGCVPEKDLHRIFVVMQTFYFDFLLFWRSNHNNQLNFHK
ncbi:MAG: hypothetical protein J6X84_06750 [Treponema sp.]|jgi:hypothetical protein|nr:hypothetical protein [Treponema sp.]